jgi:outer membrane protein assembly factor BamD (BamD/ComL family)
MSLSKSKNLIIITITALLLSAQITLAETWHLSNDSKWQNVADDPNGKFMLDVANIKQLIIKGETKPAQKSLAQLKQDYPELDAKDVDAFIEAEMLFSKRKWVKAMAAYDKFLDAYPNSWLYESALERQYDIAVAFLKGEKRKVLGILKLSAYDDADAAMNRIADRTGDSPLAKRSLITLARSYEERGEYHDAYEIWADISSRWPTGDLGRDALLEMGQTLHSAYRGPRYDSTSLNGARTYYENFKLRYPKIAEERTIDAKIKLIDEQLAYKDLQVAEYYLKTESMQAANLYYQAVLDQYPQSTAAKIAADQLVLIADGNTEPTDRNFNQKVFKAGNDFLDNWFGLGKK